MRIRITAVLLFLTSVSFAQQQSTYPVFETDKISPAEHKARRDKLKERMGPGTLGVFFTNPERNRNNDTDFLFRGESNFLYLTGFEEPDAALVLIPSGVELNGKRVTEVLFTNVSDRMSETWLGYRMGPDNSVKLLGIEAALPNTEFSKVLPKLAEGATNKKLVAGAIPDGLVGQLARMVKSYQTWKEGAGFSDGPRANQILYNMRAVKSDAEIAILKKVCDISARAHVEVMRSMKPGMREYEAGALIRYLYMREGCEYDGYPPICGSGPNGTILHYDSNRGPLKAGDMIVNDSAGEFHGYSADVTRSYPIGGKFSKEQRAIYEVVFKAQEAGIAKCRAGGNMGEVSNAAADVLAKGLMQLGIIKNRGDLRLYYMHGIGHGIGLDVHDPTANTFQPNVVVTVEPGIYIKAGSPCDKKWWNIGCRIEDDILVTNSEPINLSGACPREPDAIEKLMKETGIGNVKSRPITK